MGVLLVNLSIMKNNLAKAIRYSTLTAICQVLDCQPGALLSLAAAHCSRDDVSGTGAAGVPGQPSGDHVADAPRRPA